MNLAGLSLLAAFDPMPFDSYSPESRDRRARRALALLA